MAQKIAVAHHRDDSVETILLNLIRGTGIRGLTGIPPINGYIIRPLLCLSRNDILEYLKERKLSYVDDSTNSEDLYSRNKIRLNIIPQLETINPSVKEAIIRTSGNLSQVANIYHMYINQAKSAISKDNKISIGLLVQYVEPEAILFEILSPYGFNPATIQTVFESLLSQSGKTFHSATHELLKDRSFLILKKKEALTIDSFNINEGDRTITHPIHIRIEKTLINSDFAIERNTNILYLDAGKIIYPLTLRHWRQGDKFIPFGMKGKKKVSDYFSDHKFNLFDKDAAWLLCSGDDIVWIVGHRSDDRFKVDDKTTEVIKITYKTEDSI